MKIFYIDESGTSLRDKQSPYFLLAAFSLSIVDLKSADNKMYILKRHLIGWAKPEDYEIKGRDIRRGEKFFKSMNWYERLNVIHQISDLISELICRIFSVRIDKRHLPEYISSDDQMYRLAFTRLLDIIDIHLQDRDEFGMLMIDARSDLHSSVQDRRLIDSYRDWLNSKGGETNIVELPWFGFSAFYSGLQLADFAAYLIDFVSNELHPAPKKPELEKAYEKFKDKVYLLTIP